MPRALVRIIDRLLAMALLAGARASWPVLRLVPSQWLRPFLMPTARHLRRALGRAIVVLAVVLAAADTLMTVLH